MLVRRAVRSSKQNSINSVPIYSILPLYTDYLLGFINRRTDFGVLLVTPLLFAGHTITIYIPGTIDF